MYQTWIFLTQFVQLFNKEFLPNVSVRTVMTRADRHCDFRGLC